MCFSLIAETTMVENFFLTLWVIFKVAAGLGFVIFVHELGHFLVAKMCGVKCEKFLRWFRRPNFTRTVPPSCIFVEDTVG